MIKTHKQHLKEYGYTQTAQNPYNNEEAEKDWRTLVRNNGENNVWDYRILDEAFDMTHAEHAFGITMNVVRRSDGKVGSLSVTNFKHYVPRFYYDFREAQDDQP